MPPHSHHHSHSHSQHAQHQHGHGSHRHGHGLVSTEDSGSRLGWAFFLNLGFTIIEFIGGWLTNSTAIMADAIHDLGDSLALGSGWLLYKLGKKAPTAHYTYGYRRLSLFGALLNCFILIAGSVWILAEAIPRLSEPVMPLTEGMMVLAVLGITVNGFAAYKLSGGKTLNERVLNWHLLEDVLGWVAVLLAALVMQFVDWPIIDPLLSIAFTLFILFNVLRNLRSTARLFFQAVPDAGLLAGIEQRLLAQPEVKEVHHLHLWSLDGEQHVLSAHLVVALDDLQQYQQLKRRVEQQLVEFKLLNTMIEIELAGEACRDHTHHGKPAH